MRQDEKLETLAKYHERMAESIRLTIAALHGSNIERAQRGFADKMNGALMLRGNDNGNGKPARKKPGPKAMGAKGGTRIVAQTLKEHGKLTLEALKAKLRDEGHDGAISAIGAACRYGYVKWSGKGKKKLYDLKTMPPAEIAGNA